MRHLIVLVCTGLFVSLAHADEPLTPPCLEPSAAPAAPTPLLMRDFSDGTRLREMGMKGYLGQAYEGGPMGGALYFRAHRQGGSYGLESSRDLISGYVFRQAALLRYFQKHTRGSLDWQTYAVLGGGVPYNFLIGQFGYNAGRILQAGGGVDARLTKRFSLNADLRYFSGDLQEHRSVEYDFDRIVSSVSFGVITASLGLSITFESPMARAGKGVKRVVLHYLR